MISCLYEGHQAKYVDGFELEIFRERVRTMVVTGELDRMLVNAVQINPRIKWQELETILGVSAALLAHRWDSLIESKRLWTGCHYHVPRGDLAAQVVALVEVDCLAKEREAAIGELVLMPNVLNVRCTTGRSNLLLTIESSSPTQLDHYLDTVLREVPGVIGILAHYLRATYRDGSDWRLNELDSEQFEAVQATLPERTGDAKVTPELLTLLDLLKEDVRMPDHVIAEQLHWSPEATVETVASLQASSWARFSIDFSHGLFGGIGAAMLWINCLQVPVFKVAWALQAFPSLRLCASVTGEANLVATFRMSAFSELDTIENELADMFPGIQLLDRWIIPRMPKQMGHLVDTEGRKYGYVPLLKRLEAGAVKAP